MSCKPAHNRNAPWANGPDDEAAPGSSRGTARPAARSTCPWDGGEGNGSENHTNGGNKFKPAFRSTCPWDPSNSDAAPVATKSRVNTCPWEDVNAERPNQGGNQRGMPAPPWGLDDGSGAADAAPVSAPAPPAAQEGPSLEQIETLKKNTVKEMIDAGCPEEQIIDELDRIDKAFKVPPPQAQGPASGGQRQPEERQPSSASEAAYKESCDAAKATAAKANGGGMAGIFYG